MDINIGSIFQKADSDDLFEVIEVDLVRKTAILESKTGETKAQSFTTLKDKRRWLFKEDPAELTKQAEVLTEAGTVKKIKNMTVKSPVSGSGVTIKDYAVATAKKLGAEICESNGRFISFKTNGKMFAAIFSYSKKSLTLGVRSKAIEGIQAHSVVNHMMDARFKFSELSDGNMDLITNILASAFEYQNSLKKKKED